MMKGEERYLSFENLENDTFYGIYVIASNENPDLKTAEFSNLEFKIFTTDHFRVPYVLGSNVLLATSLFGMLILMIL